MTEKSEWQFLVDYLAAIVAAIIVTGQTYPLWFFLIPMIC